MRLNQGVIMRGRDLINMPLLLVSIMLLVLGYILLGQGPVDSVGSWKIAPVLLIFVYIFLLPFTVFLQRNKQ